MSGDKQVTSGSGGGGGRKSSDFSIAAAAGKLIVGTAAIAATGVGLAVYGTCKGAVALTKFGVRKYREHKAANAAAEAEMMSNLKTVLENTKTNKHKQQALRSKITTQLGSYNMSSHVSGASFAMKEYVDVFSKTTEDKLRKLEATQLLQLTNLEKSAEKAPSLKRLTDECQRITEEWCRERDNIVKTEISNVSKKIDSAAENLMSTYRDMLRSIDKIDRSQKHTSIKQLAETSFNDAKLLTELLASTPGTTAFEAQSLVDLTNQLNKAYRLCETQQYERCFAMCEDIILQGKEVLKDVLIKHERSEARRERITCEIAEIAESIAALEKVKFDHKGTTYTESLKAYCPEGFRTLQSDSDELICMLHDDMNDFEFNEAEHKLANLKANFRAIYRFAWDKMICSYKANDCSERIAKEFLKQGYEVEDYTFEGEVEGEKLHVNFINRKAGNDRVTLVLDMKSSYANAQLHQYGGNKTQKLPDLSLQTMLGEIVRKEVAAETGEPAVVTSKNEGSYSTDTAAADLTLQQQQTQIYPYRS